MKLQTIIFIGRSGSGKGTQSENLQKHLRAKNPDAETLYIETGQHFRVHIKDSGYTWDLAREVNERGGRQPDFLAVWVWSHLFLERMRGGEHLVFDGTPRSLGEAHMLDTALPFYKRDNPVVVFLDVSREWAEARLAGRGRGDDLNPDVVARRLSWFEKDVVPAIEFYRENPRYRFLHINGEQSPEKVFEDILRGVEVE